MEFVNTSCVFLFGALFLLKFCFANELLVDVAPKITPRMISFDADVLKSKLKSVNHIPVLVYNGSALNDLKLKSFNIHDSFSSNDNSHPLDAVTKNETITTKNSVAPLIRTAKDNSTAVSSPIKPSEALSAVLECFGAESALQCLNQHVSTLLGAWKESIVKMVRGDGDKTVKELVNNGLDAIVRDAFRNFYDAFVRLFSRSEDTAVTAKSNQELDTDNRKGRDSTGLTDLLTSYIGEDEDSKNPAKDERGHKKKKKAVKKFVITLILGKFLLLIKKKMILGMIQSVVITKLIFAAALYVLTLTFKIWHEIRKSKHQHDDKHIVYYDSTHHDHTYELPEHAEYDESYSSPYHHHGSSSDSGGGWGWGSLWGRSYTAKPPFAHPSNIIRNPYYSAQSGKVPFKSPYFSTKSPFSSLTDEDD